MVEMSETTDPEHLWTVPEVAQRLSVSVETVRRWLRDYRAGEHDKPTLRGLRLSQRAGWRVREADLQAFLRERLEAPPGGAGDQ